MIYVKSLFACVLLATIVTAQLPNLGYCPERGNVDFLKKINSFDLS